jgi:metallo-beta-lactamase family protein
MKAPTLTIHGAANTVTGSCFDVSMGGSQVLVDCGLFQGSRTLETLNREPFAFDPRRLDAVLLTHAHIDHSGLLPRLVRLGFGSTIWCTAPTLDLLKVMLPDAARIQEHEAERRNRRADRADEAAIEPLYTAEDAKRVLELIRTAELNEAITPAAGITARFWNAGHILGSASVELEAGGVRTIFSGDLGPQHKSFHADPEAPSGVDHVICESTYGDRERDTVTAEERRTFLEAEVKAALARGGNLVVPVFALERTQELLLDFAHLIDEGRIGNAYVFIDSPLASKATRVFWQHQESLEDLGDREVFRHASFHFVEDSVESMRLNTISGAIILSASGMCEAGRIRHHLLHNLPRRDSTILFVGFQAQGTLGRAILEGAQRVRISGRDVAVRAQIRSIDSYSAHADRSELLDWITAREPIVGSVFLTHGEPGATEALRRSLQQGRSSIIVPQIGERYELTAGAPARRLATGRSDLGQAIGRDWQNDYADFAANLKRELQSIESGARRAEAVAKMREVLHQYSAHRAKRRASGERSGAGLL